MKTPSNPPADVDPNRIERVVEGYPIDVAVLFGSYARGDETAQSDVDIAVAFEDALSPSERLELRIDLIVDLVEALGTDEIDVADLDAIRPAVGVSALETGTVIVGGEKRVDAIRDRFERERATDETHEDRMRRFDSILDRLEGQV